MRVGIVGAGFTGLTAAYELLKKSHQVTVFEKRDFAGGLAAGFKESTWDWSLEHFFHHFFTSDHTITDLAAELGLSQKLFFSRPKSSIYSSPIPQSQALRPVPEPGSFPRRGRRISQFDSPLSVLRFSQLSVKDRVRAGLVTAYLKFCGGPFPAYLKCSSTVHCAPKGARTEVRYYERWGNSTIHCFENLTAVEWLTKFYGKETYQILWEPLLRAKFGDEADKISMVWFWARIKKRSARLGYIEGGFQVLIDQLVGKIKESEGEILLNHAVENLEDIRSRFDRLIVTTPASEFLKMAPELPSDYVQNLGSLKMVGALNLVLVLKESFLTDGTYWLNINEPGFPFVAVVEHTNFVDSRHYGGNHILYVGGYYPQNHRYFKMDKEYIFEEFLPYLKRINPSFNFSISVPDKSGTNFLISSFLFSNLLAQPIIPINYSQVIPNFKTPIPGVFLANMQMVYPWDRGVNYAVEMGEGVTAAVLS